MRRLALISVVSVAWLAPTMAVLARAPQPQKLTFDAVSVKPHAESGYYRFSFPPGGGFSASLPVEWLIGVAYDIRPLDRIIGEPGSVSRSPDAAVGRCGNSPARHHVSRLQACRAAGDTRHMVSRRA